MRGEPPVSHSTSPRPLSPAHASAPVLRAAPWISRPERVRGVPSCRCGILRRGACAPRCFGQSSRRRGARGRVPATLFPGRRSAMAPPARAGHRVQGHGAATRGRPAAGDPAAGGARRPSGAREAEPRVRGVRRVPGLRRASLRRRSSNECPHPAASRSSFGWRALGNASAAAQFAVYGSGLSIYFSQEKFIDGSRPASRDVIDEQRQR